MDTENVDWELGEEQDQEDTEAAAINNKKGRQECIADSVLVSRIVATLSSFAKGAPHRHPGLALDASTRTADKLTGIRFGEQRVTHQQEKQPVQKHGAFSLAPATDADVNAA